MADCKVVPDKIPDRKDAFSYKSSCAVYNDKYVKLARPLDSPATDNADLIEPIAPSVVEDVKSMPNGLYTYMLFEDNTFMALPVENVFEVSSIHMRLVYEYAKRGAPVILAAGELVKYDDEDEGTMIQFNVQSGTYMKDMSEACQTQAIAAVRKFLSKTIRNRFNPAETFIIDKVYPVTKAQLDKYIKAGLEVRMYDNPKVCRNFLTNPEYSKARLDAYASGKTPEQLETDSYYKSLLTAYENSKKTYVVYTSGGRRRNRDTQRRKKPRTRTTKVKKLATR
jgi:hypothetical protein